MPHQLPSDGSESRPSGNPLLSASCCDNQLQAACHRGDPYLMRGRQTCHTSCHLMAQNPARAATRS
eukprot:CAMPEP_0180829476 /NCGR_PEP_ID=MMETSP1038_2-20121128/75280_1 /TAXON_ID=632150 /ORGANISM="Azadinium spinosum, Strain 3D9" /LENGTH=65 /DNA_ID=CAMNT_0022872519 /DNA_START=516 /DNA_END=713 /DNA_ORIENTATION=+